MAANSRSARTVRPGVAGEVRAVAGPGTGPVAASTPAHAAASESGLFATTPVLDRLIHERLRLGIVSALAVNHSLTFNDLKHLLKTTDGNLSVHARKLEEAGYVTCRKYFDGRLPRTEYRLTVQGQQALERYLDEMETLIRTTRGQ